MISRGAIRQIFGFSMCLIVLLGAVPELSAEQPSRTASVNRFDPAESYIANLMRAVYGVGMFHETFCESERYRLNMVLWEIYGGRMGGVPIFCDGNSTQSLLRGLRKSSVVYEELEKVSECRKAMFLRDASDYLDVNATDWLSTRSLATNQPLYNALYQLYGTGDWECFSAAMKSAWESGAGEDVISVAGCVPRGHMLRAEALLKSLDGNDGGGAELAQDVYCLFRVREQNAKGSRRKLD